jgi:hypothetical protein
MIGRFPAYDTNPIAVFSLICMRESKEFKANARLIAAAPMLLQEVAALQATNAALRAALEAAVARVELANSEGNPILSAWLPDARAALAGQGVQS